MTNCSESISVCGRIEYAVDSFYPGALMYLVSITNESLNSYSSVMLAVPRNMGAHDNFSISHIPPGRYNLLAFLTWRTTICQKCPSPWHLLVR